MKKILIFLSIVLLETKCHVVPVNHTKTTESSKVRTENETGESSAEIKDANAKNIVENTKMLMTERKRVYLEDVFYNLKNQNWTTEEEPCLNQTLLLLKGLQNFSLWAVWEWDSISSEPTGLLFGSSHQLGNFDECLEAPWRTTQPELQAQYCLANIKLERTDKSGKRLLNESFDPYQSALDYIQHHPQNMRPLNELLWGLCVPVQCNTKSVGRLLSVMLARSHIGSAGMVPKIKVDEKCQRANEALKFDGLFWAFIAVMCCLLGISLICTFLNCRKGPNSDNIVIKAFCIKTNAKDLLKMKKEGTEILYGIRFLTISLIVSDHQVSMLIPRAISNGRNVDHATLSTEGMLLIHDDLFVDSFFLLSGFLAACVMMRFKKFPNPFIMILKRYVRLVVAYAVVIFFLCAVFPYIGSGPLWPKVINAETEPCKRNWWLSLLMVNNYINSEDICYLISWYIPCDFHFFVISVFLFWLYKRLPQLSLTCFGALAVASVLIPGAITYINKLPAVQLLTYDFAVNPKDNAQFHLTYIKSHTRFAAYLVGFGTGCIFASYKATGNINRLSQKWAIIGSITGILIGFVIMVIGPVFIWRDYPPWICALYAALNRPVWSVGLALLVLSCSLGHVPLIKGFLSWYAWVPLSRLSYGLYLTHAILINRNIFVTRNSELFDYTQLMTESAGVIFWGSIASLALWLLTEAPANKLLAALLSRRSQDVSTSQDPINGIHTSSTGTVDTEGKGYQQDNMPNTVSMSSKI